MRAGIRRWGALRLSGVALLLFAAMVPASARAVSCGDADGDGVVSAKDALFVLHVLDDVVSTYPVRLLHRYQPSL